MVSKNDIKELKIVVEGIGQAVEASEKNYLKQEDVFLCPATREAVDDEYCRSFSNGKGCRCYNNCNRVPTKIFVEGSDDDDV